MSGFRKEAESGGVFAIEGDKYMECEKAQEVMWPAGHPRAHAADVEEAAAHVAGCPSCAAFLERDAKLGERLAQLECDAECPDALRASIHESLAQPASAPLRVSLQGSRLQRWRVPLGAAAALLAAFAAGLQLSRTGVPAARADLFAEDFMRIAAAPPTNTDPVSIEAFYEDRLGVGVRPVELAGGTVRKALVCDIRGDRGATIEYDMQGTRLAHYRIPTARLSEQLAPGGALEITMMEDGVRVARWVDEDFEHALVGNVPAERMERLIGEVFGPDAQPPLSPNPSVDL